jgi:metallophosphoesterase superfamily enzyme
MRVPSETSQSLNKREVQPGIWLDGRRACWLAEVQVLVIADLHWGYAVSHRARGNLLPVWGDEQIAAMLDQLIADYAPREMLWLGDVVHAAEGAAAAERFLDRSIVPVCVIGGNHDRRWRRCGEPTAIRGRFFFHHGDIARAAPEDAVEVIGHHHPAVGWSDGAGGNVKLPVLVASPRRLILPAFSPWAAGTDCWPLMDEASTAWAIAPKRIFSVVPRIKKPTAA